MKKTTFQILPRDPLIFRDGRPFGADAGARAKSLPWPFPSTLAGAIRTQVGRSKGNGTFPRDFAEPAKSIALKGPILGLCFEGEKNFQPYLPVPSDAVANALCHYPLTTESEPSTYPAKAKLPRRLCPHPMPSGSGWNGPASLLPVADEVKGFVLEQRKSDWSMPTYWSLANSRAWLLGEDPEPLVGHKPTKRTVKPGHYFDGFEHEVRIHVGINAASGTAADGMLYQTDSLVLTDFARAKVEGGLQQASATPSVAILGAVEDPHEISNWAKGPLTLGGERRLAVIAQDQVSNWLEPDEDFVETLAESIMERKGLRLQLVSPGAFYKNGWCPDLLSASESGVLTGSIAGFRLTLKAAALARWEPVSGWDMAAAKKDPIYGWVGEKPITRLVPSGAVYWFDLASEDGQSPLEISALRALVRELWMGSLCCEQFKSDGFGLCVPGIDTTIRQENHK